MKKNNNLPEPDVFTSKIEETIDDLFKPAKQIEIDPLTQEVKEVTTNQQQADSESEISLELAIEEPVPEEVREKEQEPVLELSEAEPTEGDEIVEPVQDELFLEPDSAEEEEPQIELELVEEESETIVEEMVSEEQPDKISSTLQRLREDIYTIEWEVSKDELSETITELEKIIELPEIKDDSAAFSLLSLSTKVLESAKKAPHKMKTNAPSVLKRAIEAVIALRSEGSLAKDEIETIKHDLNRIIDRELEPSPKETHTHFKTEPKPQPQMEKPAPGAVSEEPGITDEAKKFEWNEETKQLLVAHLKELQRQVNRIRPLEQLLLKTPGMEKLYKFQKNVRQNLENEIEKLSLFFFKDIDIELPRQDKITKQEQEDYASEITTSRCPWNQLFTLSINGLEIGIPSEEVVYISQPPWLSKFFIKKADVLPLSKLKTWPWSKLSKIFTNRLAKMPEAVLSKMEFPVVKRFEDMELTNASNFYLIILFNGEKGAVLRTKESPIAINIPQNAKCQEITRGFFAGEIEINGNKIAIITSESVNR